MLTNLDWAELAPRAAIRLLGEPDRREQGGRVWRWSGRGGLTLDVQGQYAGRFHVWSEGDETLGLLDMIRQQTGADPMQWLADNRLVQHRQDRNKPAKPQRPPEKRGTSRNPVAEWASAVRIPQSAEHPARLWLADWGVWRPGHPLPDGLRWQSAAESDRYHNPRGLRNGHRHPGAGNIAALVAPLSSWAASWPEAPEPVSLHLVAVSAEGRKTPDCPECGIDKRTIGPRAAGVFAIGNPADPQWPPRVVEGVKDALAVAAHYSGPVYAVLGSMANPATDLVCHLANSPVPAVIHADNDEKGYGRIGSRAMAAAVMKAGGMQPRIIYAPLGKDAADTARLREFPPIDVELARGYAETLRESQYWPEWEIIRQTALAVGDE